MTRARDLADYISTGVSDTELDVLDGVTAGTVTASKALVVDANKDIATIRNITSSGTITGVTSLTVDDITINGSTISDAADLTVDVGGAITLDADGGYIDFADGGTTIGRIENSSSDFKFEARVQDKDILFVGNDGGSGITALQLDISDAGSAIFNNHVYISDNSKLQLGAASDLQIYHDTSNSYIAEAGTGNLNITSNSDLTVDVAGNITLDADGANIIFKDGGTEFGHISQGGGPNVQLISMNNLSLRSNNGTTATGNIVWVQGSARPWNTSYFDLGSSTYKWKDLYLSGSINVDGTVDGIDIAGNINQAVKTTSSPQFANVYIDDKIYHHADSDTYISFTTDTVQIYAGNSYAQFSSGMLLLNDGSLAEDYDALSGTTPTIDVSSGGMFSLTTSGNTTFTFSGASSGYIQGFVLQLTAGGSHTITYPNSVDWAGGSAPDAPASGETDILVFITRDGGTTWYGALALDAAG